MSCVIILSMKIFKNLQSEMYEKLFNSRYKKECLKGEILPFDGSFYAMFDGMYFNGLPIYYYLKKMSMGKCYDASAILALAMGKNCYVCRGELKTMSKIYQECFGHGWVETEDKVYDTTWQIILNKELYYKIFGVELTNKRTQEQFFKDCEEMSDWHIYSKEHYENKYNMSNLLVFQIHQMAELHLRNPRNEEDRAFYEQLRKDLPDFEKIKLMPDSISIVKKATNSEEEPEA